MVVHVLADDDGPASPVVGFVVSKAVGGAVVRNRTKRRLRALVRPLVDRLRPGTRVVVRAQPAAAAASSSTLSNDLAGTLGRAGALRAATRTGGPA
jgi:ribonuclease P protein component